MPETHVDALLGRLDAVRRRIRMLFLLDGTARLALALAVFVVATFALDWLFILPRRRAS